MLQLIGPVISSALAISLASLGLRVFGGVSMANHGYPKLFGKDRSQVKEKTVKLGIPSSLFDLISVLEFLGGVFVAVGFLTPLASGLLALQMVGNALWHVRTLRKPPFSVKFRGGYEIDILYLAIMLAIFILGPGMFSMDKIL